MCLRHDLALRYSLISSVSVSASSRARLHLHLRERACVCASVCVRNSAWSWLRERRRLRLCAFSNDFVVSAMKTIFQFDECQGDTVFGARRCAHDRRNFCDKEPPSRVHRLPERVRHSRKKKSTSSEKKRPYGCTLEAPDVAVSAQCVAERAAVVSDMMDIVICVDHSCVFGIS